uniref:Uncharacterized protein n=1 Tax=Aegilops tauschii TaxID=37682 RepID=M8ARG8_AEGTA
MLTADLEAAIAALPGKKQRLRESFHRLVACAPPHVQLPFTWHDIDAYVSSLHSSLSLRFRRMQQWPHPVAPLSTPHDEFIQEDQEMVRDDEDESSVEEMKEHNMQKDREDMKKKVSLPHLDTCTGFVAAPCHRAGGTLDQEFWIPTPVHAPYAGNPMLQQPYMGALQPDVMIPVLGQQQPYMAYQQEFPAMRMRKNVPTMVHQLYTSYFGQEFFLAVLRQHPMGIDHVLQKQRYMSHHQPYFPQHPMAHHGYTQRMDAPGFPISQDLGTDAFPDSLCSRKNILGEVFSMLKAPENGIQKDVNQVTMLNKTTNFKKKGKSNKKGKSKGPNKADTPGKSKKTGATADAECFFCTEKGHWKRNCKKYLAEKKKSAKSSRGMSVIHRGARKNR